MDEVAIDDVRRVMGRTCRMAADAPEASTRYRAPEGFECPPDDRHRGPRPLARRGDEEAETDDREHDVRRPDGEGWRNSRAERRALERRHHQVVDHQDRQAADEGDAPAAAVRADRERKRDEPKDERGERERITLVALDLERRAAVGVVPKLGDLLRELAQAEVFLGLLDARRALQ